MNFRRINAYRSFWPKSEKITQFGELGVDTVAIFPANTKNTLGTDYVNCAPHWLHEDVYDWGIVDAQFDSMISANPDVRFICMVDLNTPTWLARYFRCDDSFYGLGKVAANGKWREVTAEYMRCFLERIESRYGDRIASYILMCGATDEWQDLSKKEESESRRAAWRKWSVENGDQDPVDIPPKSARDSASHGLFRDPVQDSSAIRYSEYCNDLIAETIIYFVKKAQNLIKKRVSLGIFFGYILEHAQEFQSKGHLAFDKVFACDDIDFFVSPVSYQDREMGGASGIMVTLDSLKLHGKGYIREIDHLTPTSNACPKPMSEKNSVRFTSWNHRWMDEEAAIAGLRREFAIDLITGDSYWWFDMWNGWYESEGILSAMRQMCSIWQEYTDQDHIVQQRSEIAVIVDAKSCMYLNEYDAEVKKMLYTLRKALGRIGAPFNIYSYADLAKIDFSHCKLVIMPNFFWTSDERMNDLEKHLFCNNKTVLWVNQAGVIKGDSYSLDNIKALTGIEYIPGSIGEACYTDWRSVLHCDLEPGVDFIREEARKSGVHIYIEQEEPVYVNDRFLCVHSAIGGVREIKLPERYTMVRDVFNNQVVMENNNSFTVKLNAPDTVLYELIG